METPSATAAAVAGPAGAAGAATAAASASSATAAVVATPAAAAAAAAANAAGAATASASRGGRAKSSTTKKRHALPLGRPSSTRPSESGEMPPTPTDQMAPSSFAYETPSPSSSRSVRGVRARQNETAVQSPDDADSKGGRSLRRKPRIDYSFDHVEASETFAARVTPSAARSLKKRKTDISFHDGDADEEHELRVKRRASEQPLAAAGSSRRKAAARKNTVEPQMYVPEQHLEEAEVQDTIEVGGRHSMHSDDSFRARTSSGGSSHHDLTPKAGPPLSSISQPPPPPTSSIPPSSPSPPSPQQPVFLAQPVSVPTDAESGVVAVSSTHSPQQETKVLTSTAPASALNESAIEDDEPEPEPEPVEEPRPVETPEPLKEPGPAQEQVQEPVKELDSIQPPQEGQVFTEPAPAESIAEPVVESAVKESTSEPEEKQPDPPLQVESEPPPQPKQEHEAEPLPLPKPLPETQPETLPEALPETQPEPKGTTPPPPTTSESQPDPKSPVKPSSPKASRKKASAVEIPAAKPIKEELKEKPVAKPTLVKNASIPAVTVSKPAEPRTRKQSVNDPLGHLTPYVDGAFVWLPKLKANGEADADGEPEAEADQDAPADGDADATLDDADEPVEGADEETPIGTPLAPETAANSPAPELELASMLPSKRQFAFRKTREAAEFTALFDDVKSLSYTDLYYRLEVANMALQAWQNEFNKLRLVTEDEDNSMRYHQEEAAFRQREKMALSKDPSANPLRKDYIVKGLRASKPDAHLAYMRQQDKVMAQAYGFDYDDRESKIGQQDPHAQRTGAAGKARLRDRPKQTAKAAESDDPAVISGKRARKAPTLFDGLESVSRSSTPAPTSQPKGRRRRGAGQGGDEINDLQSSPPEANSEVVPTRKGKGGRPRKHPLPATQTDVTSAPAVDDGPTLPTPNILERPARKRRRRDLDEEDEALANGTASEASKKAKRRNSRLSEVPTGSFYSQSSTYADEDNRPATASSTASNTTADSSPNNYSLREKRQKKFSLDDGEYDDVGGAEDDDGATANHSRPAKRARRGPRKTYFEPVMPLPDEYMADVPQSEQSQAQAPKPTPKIKIKNYQPSGASPATAAAILAPLPPLTTSVPVSSPYSPAPSQTMDSPTTQTGSFHSNGHTPQTEPELEKDYSTMTKSEKMSYSMKARWASGSMSAAVSKRRATLAAKKSARAATPPKPSAAVAATPGATEPPTGDAHPPAVAK